MSKRSVTIAGHRTSLSLEDEFWNELKAQADAEGISTARLIEQIDSSRGQRNLSSAIRVHILARLQTRQGLP